MNIAVSIDPDAFEITIIFDDVFIVKSDHSDPEEVTIKGLEKLRDYDAEAADLVEEILYTIIKKLT